VPTPPKEPAARIRMAVEREFARRLQDVVYVSTYWGHERWMTGEWLEPIAGEMGSMLGWDSVRTNGEIDDVLSGQYLPSI